MQETQVRFLGWEDSLEKEMTTHSSILAWRIHGQRSLVGYTVHGLQEPDTIYRLNHHHKTFHYYWQQVSLQVSRLLGAPLLSSGSYLFVWVEPLCFMEKKLPRADALSKRSVV